MKSFKEYLNEKTNSWGDISPDKVKNIPNFLKGVDLEIIYQKMTHGFARILDTKKPAFVKYDIDPKTYEMKFLSAYYANSKSAERRGKFSDLTPEIFKKIK